MQYIKSVFQSVNILSLPISRQGIKPIKGDIYMAKYQIWNRQDMVITPSGEVFTPEQWIAKHPMAGLESLKTVISGNRINGSLFYEFTDFVSRARKAGCDFSGCMSDQDYLDSIESFEEEQTALAMSASEEPTAEERIAAALELQNLMAMENTSMEG